MDWRVILGEKVRQLRLERGITQEQLAFEAKVDLTYVGGIERGRRNPSLLVIARIAAALGAEPADLIAQKARAKDSKAGMLNKLVLCGR
ncbi:helix-turn-helix domain-containing protein [Brevundimonas bacteroides]|uniref:helix-turn-helix domain-containing protein n=1 Tax=Brevundimonas bacteroides TaxID=74311 RepID=UPI0009FC5F37|nr:helix-turn-helix transcriptional regulator [Brevundimonas bacteroides]